MGKLTPGLIKELSEPGRYSDGEGLLLQISPSGGKSWLMRVQVNGRRRDIGLGELRHVSLRDARLEAAAIKKLAKSGVDPLDERRKVEIVIPTFEQAAIVLGYEAFEHRSLRERTPWMRAVKWPLMCFIAVAFWNMLGAGVFGFMINTPVALFYLQGLNTTPVHAHAALFGVYGFLALGFTLLVLRYIRLDIPFNDRLMVTGFWGLNAGLVPMVFTSLLPVGLFRFRASVTTGMWYARSETFLQGFLETLRWVRTFGDVVFMVGAIAIAWQVVIPDLWRKGARA